VLPLQLLEVGPGGEYFYLIKTIRLYIGLDFLDPSAIVQTLQHFNQRRLRSMIEKKDWRSVDTDRDHTHGSTLLLAGYVLRVLKYTIMILTTCYFLGCFWHIYCVEEYRSSIEFNKNANPLVFNTETFVTSNDLVPGEGSRTALHVMFLNMYYAYTTLSTVGFGDLNPRADSERLLCIVIFLLGVGIFALFMGLFLEIIAKFNAYGADVEESADLLRFFSAIASYNGGVEMGVEWRR